MRAGRHRAGAGNHAAGEVRQREALGREPERPAALQGIEDLLAFSVMPADPQGVKAYISAHVSA